MRSLYISGMRGLRAVARRLGILAALERRSAVSRRALWWRSLFAIYDFDDMVALDLPWWTFEAIDAVEEALRSRPRARAFEWGAGASTVWLSRRCAEVVSIEHDPEWFARMVPALADNVELRHVPAAPSATPRVASAKPGFAGLDFGDYVAAIDDASGLFDIVVIDGRAREACLPKALERLAPGGIVVFDNVGRRRYREAITAAGDRVVVRWTRGRTTALPYPDETALLSLRA